MAINRGFSKLITPGFKRVAMNVWKEREFEGKAITNQMTESERAYVEHIEMAGFGSLQLKGEGAPITYADPAEGGTKRYVFLTYGLGFRVTEEMYDDELYDMVGNKLTESLTRSARNNKEVVMHAPYNNAFNTAYSGFTASKSLCSTSQTLIKGGTASNRPATDADFDLLTFQAAIEHFENLTNEEGFPCHIKPKWLLHSPGDSWIVNQVLKSERLPGGDQNDINHAAAQGVTPRMSHYLTDTDAWFLIGDQHEVNYISRKRYRFTSSDEFHTGDALFKGQQRHTSGFDSWRGIYGTSGG